MTANTKPLPTGFGTEFTSHLTTIRYTSDGWGETVIGPYEDLTLSPAAMVLHYGQAIFEGLKAYRQPDGEIGLFRPDKNAERMQHSAARMSMAELPVDRFLDALYRHVDADRDSVPDASGYSLYMRPFMIATEAMLGTRPANEYSFMIIASPSGPYFKNGYNAVTLAVSHDYPRAFPGGTGSAKCAGNYAAGMIAQKTASAVGADQVLFLDAIEGKYLEELGGMNVFVVSSDGERTIISTPPLSDTILHGITRDALLRLAADSGAEVVERRISLDEVRADAANGKVTEAFACGTAAVVTPIGKVLSKDGDIVFGDGQPGPWATNLRTALVDIQEGRAADPYGWVVKVPHY